MEGRQPRNAADPSAPPSLANLFSPPTENELSRLEQDDTQDDVDMDDDSGRQTLSPTSDREFTRDANSNADVANDLLGVSPAETDGYTWHGIADAARWVEEAARAAAAESDFQGGGSLGAMSVEAQYHQQQLLLRQQQQEQLQRLRIQQEQQLAIQQQIWLEERRQLEEQQRVREAAQRAQREADSNADVASDLLGVGGGGGHTWHGESERWLDMLNLRSSHDPSGGVTPTGAASGQHTPRDAMSPVAWGTTHSSASTTTPPSALQDAPSTLSGLFEPPTRAEDQTTPVSSPSGGPPPRATPTHPTATRLFSTFQPPSNTIPSMSAGGRARGGGPSMSGPPGGNTLPDLAAIARNGPRMYPPANNGARMVPPRNSDALMAQAGLAAGQNTWHFRDPALQEQWASFLLEKRERSASPEPGR